MVQQEREQRKQLQKDNQILESKIRNLQCVIEMGKREKDKLKNDLKDRDELRRKLNEIRNKNESLQKLLELKEYDLGIAKDDIQNSKNANTKLSKKIEQAKGEIKVLKREKSLFTDREKKLKDECNEIRTKLHEAMHNPHFANMKKKDRVALEQTYLGMHAVWVNLVTRMTYVHKSIALHVLATLYLAISLTGYLSGQIDTIITALLLAFSILTVLVMTSEGLRGGVFWSRQVNQDNTFHTKIKLSEAIDFILKCFDSIHFTAQAAFSICLCIAFLRWFVSSPWSYSKMVIEVMEDPYFGYAIESALIQLCFFTGLGIGIGYFVLQTCWNKIQRVFK